LYPNSERSTSTLEWFAAQVWPGRERVCAAHLSVRGYEVFLPCYRERRQWSDRMKTVERALFAGYVFCRLSGEVFAKVVTTPGVIRIVGDGRRPLPVAGDEIEALQSMTASKLAYEPSELLEAGQRVRVIAGPLADCEGLVVRSKGRHRLVITVSLLRRSVAVEINPDWLCPVAAAPFDGVPGWSPTPAVARPLR